ncbi:hypothetical protein ASF61_15020 [Duganella sp. Leaf126]|uniref:hypothetical protein n=1 Tax=Duganella sp. Leaf126 TaxID=1736266 RepID=UPI0006FD3F35|nr:hypothetical protein [Duganella sp. Leaf126]KQQ32354.1 hypothetical protein ASF61_15020 [Duganella sp. Leaf126]
MNLSKLAEHLSSYAAAAAQQPNDAAATAEDPLSRRVKQLLQQTGSRLAQNELREWGKLLLTQAPAVKPPTQGGHGKHGKHGKHGAAGGIDKRLVKKTAVAAVALGVGYYLLKRR